MRVLVTGSSGLVGSAMVAHACRLGCDVVGVDNNQRADFFGPAGDTRPTLAEQQRRFPTFRHVDLDVRDRGAVDRLVRTGGFALVVHAAAQPSHDLAARRPFDDFDVNATGTLNLLEACRQNAPECVFAFLSTNKVYGDGPNRLPFVELRTRFDFAEPAQRRGIDERFPIDQTLHSVFGASKVAADVMVQEYGRYFGLRTGVFRGGCLTGPRHRGVALHGFVNHLVRTALAGGDYVVYGFHGKQVRDQLHADDVAEALWAFAAAPRPGEVYNLGGGPENAASLLECVDRVEALCGRRPRLRFGGAERRGDHRVYYTDLSKLVRDYPAWRPRRSLDGILAEQVEALRDERPGRVAVAVPAPAGAALPAPTVPIPSVRTASEPIPSARVPSARVPSARVPSARVPAAPRAPAARAHAVRVAWVYPAHSPARVAEEQGVTARLREQGHDVRAFGIPCAHWYTFPELDRRYRGRDPALMAAYERLGEELSGRDVLVAAGGSMLHPDFVARFDGVSVFCSADDPENSELLSRPVAPHFDVALVVNPTSVAAYRAWGCAHVEPIFPALRPERIAAGVSRESILGEERPLDVVLCCEREYGLSDRAQRVEALLRAFPAATVRGPGWPLGPQPQVELYPRARLGWNLHNSTGPCNTRFLELPANGVLQLCDNPDEIGRWFVPGEEIVGFASLDECIDLTHHFLRHEDERRRIAANGHARVLRDYTEAKWFERMLAAVARAQAGAARPTAAAR